MKRKIITAALLAAALALGSVYTSEAALPVTQVPGTEESPYEQLKMTRFTDTIYGFSFQYPSNDTVLVPNLVKKGKQASEYGVGVKDLEMTIWYGAYFGGINEIDRQYNGEIHAPQVCDLLASFKGPNWFYLKFKDSRDRITEAKYYFGHKMHQRILIIYPDTYEGDAKYEDFVSRLIRSFRPSV